MTTFKHFCPCAYGTAVAGRVIALMITWGGLRTMSVAFMKGYRDGQEHRYVNPTDDPDYLAGWKAARAEWVGYLSQS